METPQVKAEHRREAEARMDEALRKTGARDPREAYRGMLRVLKLASESDYDVVVDGFQTSVVRTIVEEGADPLSVWLEFGCGLAERMSPGRDVVIDATGRATSFSPPPSWQDLILHLPSDRRSKGVVIGLPPEPTSAQQASVVLLVDGRVRLQQP